MNVIKYNLKRNSKNYKIVALLPYILIIDILLLASSLQNSFREEYMKVLVDNYPTDTFDISKEKYDSFEYKDKIETYDFYLGIEDDVTVLYLAQFHDSIFMIEDILQFGKFPDSDKEVIVTENYIINKLGGDEDNIDKYLGKEICIKDEKFTISGITYSLNEESENYMKSETFYTYLYTDVYYTYASENTVFVSYSKIAKMYEPQQCYIGKNETKTEMIRGYYRNLLYDNEMRDALRACYNDGYVNSYDKEINSAKNTVDNVVKVLFFVFVACFFIGCIFMYSQLKVELFYRKKELGYLQIFGVKKIKILLTILVGYLLKLIFSFAIALPIYAIIIGAYYICMGSLVMCNVEQVAIMFVGIFLFYTLTIILVTINFLRKSVMKLIY